MHNDPRPEARSRLTRAQAVLLAVATIALWVAAVREWLDPTAP